MLLYFYPPKGIEGGPIVITYVNLHPQQKCAGSKLLSALKVFCLNHGTFLLHKFVNKKTQQKCASIGINKNVQTPARPR